MTTVNLTESELEAINFALTLDRETVAENLEKEPENEVLTESLQVIDVAAAKVTAAINRLKAV